MSSSKKGPERDYWKQFQFVTRETESGVGGRPPSAEMMFIPMKAWGKTLEVSVSQVADSVRKETLPKTMIKADPEIWPFEITVP